MEDAGSESPSASEERLLGLLLLGRERPVGRARVGVRLTDE